MGDISYPDHRYLVAVDDVWGVGRRISKKLYAMGIENAL